jgi:hypothetical protein
MNKFIIDSHQKESVKNQFDIQENNGWVEAYKYCPGKQAYTDGVITGLNNGYAEAVWDIKKYLKQLVDENPDVKVSKVIDLIKFEK